MTPESIQVGNLHDGSTAKTHEELVRHWREEADRHWNSPVEGDKQKIIARSYRDCAADLERVNRLAAQPVRVEAGDAAALVANWRKGAYELGESALRSEGPRQAVKVLHRCADELEAIAQPPVTGLSGQSEKLFNAANTAAINLATSMNLKEHPASCECYGCGLTRAVVDFAMARAWENTREIREREAQAEKPSGELMNMRLDSAQHPSPTPTQTSRESLEARIRHAIINNVKEADGAWWEYPESELEALMDAIRPVLAPDTSASTPAPSGERVEYDPVTWKPVQLEGEREEIRLSTKLYRSLERLSIAIESCAGIGFTESTPTTNETHASIWQDLNEAQKDAKLKLKAYKDAALTAPKPAPEESEE